MISNNEKQAQVASMKTDQSFKLIKGEFTAEEAAEIVYELFNKKINFHETKSLSQFLTQGQKKPETLERIQELKKQLNEAKIFIEQAKRENKSLRLDSTILIEVI